MHSSQLNSTNEKYVYRQSYNSAFLSVFFFKYSEIYRYIKWSVLKLFRMKISTVKGVENKHKILYKYIHFLTFLLKLLHVPTVWIKSDVFAFLTFIWPLLSLCLLQTDGELVSNHHSAGLLLCLLCLPQWQHQAGYNHTRTHVPTYRINRLEIRKNMILSTMIRFLL